MLKYNIAWTHFLKSFHAGTRKASVILDCKCWLFKNSTHKLTGRHFVPHCGLVVLVHLLFINVLEKYIYINCVITTVEGTVFGESASMSIIMIIISR